jgi:hypothetical protein
LARQIAFRRDLAAIQSAQRNDLISLVKEQQTLIRPDTKQLANTIRFLFAGKMPDAPITRIPATQKSITVHQAQSPGGVRPHFLISRFPRSPRIGELA